MSNGKKPARNHHWLPQCYLKGFAKPFSKNGYLWAYDFLTDKSFKPKPKNVGVARDFNRVDIDGRPIDCIEQAMSSFESKVERAIRDTIKSTDHFPSDDARDTIFNLIALLAVRNPRFREVRRDFRQRVAETIMDVMLANPERYHSEMQSAKESGAITADIVPYEQMRDFHRRKEYTFHVRREAQIHEEFEVHDTVLQALGERNWVVFRSKQEEGTFITCDHPVFLRSKTEGDFPQQLGFGLRHVSVLFPLSKYVFLVGEYDLEPRSINVRANVVAALNSDVILAADRQVYAVDGDFRFMDPLTGAIRTGAELSSASRPDFTANVSGNGDSEDTD